MRELNGEGDKNQGYIPMNQAVPSGRRRRFNMKRFVFSLVLLVLLVSLGVWGVQHFMGKTSQTLNVETMEKAPEYTAPANGGSYAGKKIVLDAGHGGFDPGATGISGTVESELNLKMAEVLKEELEKEGMQVVMTRSDENAIAETKDEDMAKRCAITREENPDLFISIHMNSLDDNSVCGPIVLFQPGSVPGEELAKAIESSVNLNAGLLKPCSHRSGELIVLRDNSQPSVLVECGFISNKNEEANLLDDSYRRQLAKAICIGIEDFLGKGQFS